ncbi:MAG: hypothetical protein CMM93_05765 [Rickettsiales bacterium]|nr:hypothetical protein [Rickettsiales bacterium]|tara:strand:+ start:1261 stop:1572 length:312 start_codon:yes stop_codon:yes gene_type:complete
MTVSPKFKTYLWQVVLPLCALNALSAPFFIYAEYQLFNIEVAVHMLAFGITGVILLQLVSLIPTFFGITLFGKRFIDCMEYWTALLWFGWGFLMFQFGIFLGM